MLHARCAAVHPEETLNFCSAIQPQRNSCITTAVSSPSEIKASEPLQDGKMLENREVKLVNPITWKVSLSLEQRWANYGPGAIYGPLNFKTFIVAES